MAEQNKHLLLPIDWARLMRDHYPAACRIIERLMPRSLQAVYAPEDFVSEAIVQLLGHPEALNRTYFGLTNCRCQAPDDRRCQVATEPIKASRR